MSTWAFFADSGLTVPATGGAAVASNGTSTDRLIWFGSPVAGKTLQAATSPGAANVQILVTDSAPGSGVEASAIRLALSSAGLSSATPGAALSVGTTLSSGPAGAVPVYVRSSRGALGVGVYPGLSLTTSSVIES